MKKSKGVDKKNNNALKYIISIAVLVFVLLLIIFYPEVKLGPNDTNPSPGGGGGGGSAGTSTGGSGGGGSSSPDFVKAIYQVIAVQDQTGFSNDYVEIRDTSTSLAKKYVATSQGVIENVDLGGYFYDIKYIGSAGSLSSDRFIYIYDSSGNVQKVFVNSYIVIFENGLLKRGSVVVGGDTCLENGFEEGVVGACCDASCSRRDLSGCFTKFRTCTDSDGGINPDVRGTGEYNSGTDRGFACGPSGGGGGGGSNLADICLANILLEYSCAVDGSVVRTEINCVNGCTNGACVQDNIKETISSVELVAFYSFNNEKNMGYDGSANGNNAKIVGATSVAGKRGNALSFDGNDYVELWPLTATSNPAPGPFAMSGALTIAGLIKLDAVSGTQVVFARGSTASSASAEVGNLVVINGAPRFRVSNGAKFVGASSPTKLNTDVWYRLTGVFDGKQARIYVNGELAGQSAIEATPFTIHDPSARRETAIATDLDANKRNYFKGDIDDVYIWNRALSQAEIEVLARASDY